MSIDNSSGLLKLDAAHVEFVERAHSLAQSHKTRADDYDQRAIFPSQTFDDLHRAGLLSAAIPKQFGGLELGPYHGTALPLWLITRRLAAADLSLARCYEGHANSMVLIDALGDHEQKQRFYAGVRERGEVWAAWSGEPQTPTLNEKTPVGTRLTRVDGGYVIDGSKVFATSAGGARWALLLIHLLGPGGARHAAFAPEGLLLLACELTDPSVEIDTSWWNPIGMRATASHRVHFRGTFISDAQCLGTPGQYLRDGFQTAFAPHYAASFLGAADGAYEYALAYLKRQERAGDPYVQHRIAKMAIHIQTCELWLAQAAQLWRDKAYKEAQQAGVRARFVVEQLANEVVQHCIHICGARSLLRPSPVERILRDLSFYSRHDNADHVLATIGRSLLDKAHDLSFYKP